MDEKNIVGVMLDFFKFFNDSMTIGAIGEFKSNECDNFFKKCVSNFKEYTSLVEGRIGVASFKTYMLNDYLYVVVEDSCIGLDLNFNKQNKVTRIFRAVGDNFYDFSLDLYSNEVVLKQIISDKKKSSEVLTMVSPKISSSGFVGLIGMNIPNQYFSNECKKVLSSQTLYETKHAFEIENEEGKSVINKKCFWVDIDQLLSKKLPSIMEFDLVMPNKFQKSMYVLQDNGEYIDLYNYSGLSLKYNEVDNLLKENNIDINHSNEFISMIDSEIELPEKIKKLCKIVNIAKMAKEYDIDISFATIGEEE